MTNWIVVNGADNKERCQYTDYFTL